jgi:hypothetical protein
MKLRNLQPVVILTIVAMAISAAALIARADSIMDKLGAPGAGRSAMVRGGNVMAVIMPEVSQAAPGRIRGSGLRLSRGGGGSGDV